MASHSSNQIVIIGGGFSGIAVAIRLLANGIRDFVILEKASQLGGTWRDNTYPGCGCDVPSHLYSLSFAPNPDWTRFFAGYSEIQRYFLDVAERYKIEPFVRYGTNVSAARWDNEKQCWNVKTNKEEFVGQVLVLGAGPLHAPNTPALPGIDTFNGVQFHTARWNHDHDLSGRRVAVIGSGCSAIQLVPEIQPQVEQLILFQRTAAWVMPKLDFPIHRILRMALRYIPLAHRVVRGSIYYTLELLQQSQQRPAMMRQLQRIGLAMLRLQIKDPELRKQLTPKFILGCKRLMLSNTYYPAVSARNVTVVPHGVERVTPGGLVSADGGSHQVDTIVFATGYKVMDAPIGERVFGRAGKSLLQFWNGSPRAYLGTSVSGFPNMFFLVGPNSGNGHGSALIQIEAQAGYITEAVKILNKNNLASLEIRSSVQDEYNTRVQNALSTTVWNAGGCSSYYLDRNGSNGSIYPWSTIYLRRCLARFDIDSYLTRDDSLNK